MGRPKKSPSEDFYDITYAMNGHPTLTLVLLCVAGSAYIGYNFYRAWFRLEEMRSFLNQNVNNMKNQSPWQAFFRQRINYPGWALETRIVATINFVLAICVTAFVIYLYFAP